MGNEKKSDLDVATEGRWAAKVLIENDNRTIGIRKCRVKDLRLVSRAISILAAELGIDTTGKLNVDIRDASVILKLISNCADQVYLVCASLSSLDNEDFEDLDIDDGVAIATKVYEVNRDFFVEKVYPMIAPFAVLVAGQLFETGPSEEQGASNESEQTETT